MFSPFVLHKEKVTNGEKLFGHCIKLFVASLVILLILSSFVIEPGAGFDDEKSLLMSQMSLEKRFGQSAVFVASTLMENGGVPQSATPENLLKEAIHVISCGYEDKTEWGSEVSCLYSIWSSMWHSRTAIL